jgi:uncharacterized cupin superfamily protein
MSNQSVILSLSSIEPHSGPHTIPGIRFRPLRRELGITAFGTNVIDIEPKCSNYPTHDHQGDRQEEMYVVLAGQAWFICDNVERLVKAGDVVFAPPHVTRKFLTRESSVSLLAVGAAPGSGYAPTATM